MSKQRPGQGSYNKGKVADDLFNTTAEVAKAVIRPQSVPRCRHLWDRMGLKLRLLCERLLIVWRPFHQHSVNVGPGFLPPLISSTSAVCILFFCNCNFVIAFLERHQGATPLQFTVCTWPPYWTISLWFPVWLSHISYPQHRHRLPGHRKLTGSLD